MKQFYLRAVAIAIALVCVSGSARATDYYLKSGTGAITSNTSWNTQVNGLGTNAPNFNGVNDVWHFTNRTSGTLNPLKFLAPSTATIMIESGFNLTLAGTQSVVVAVINMAASSSLTAQNNVTPYNFGTLDDNSNVIYNSTAVTVKPASYGNLIIAQSTSMLSGGGLFRINGILTINSGVVLTMNGQSLDFTGNTMSVAGTGSLTGDALASISLAGGNGGNNGTFNFTSGNGILNYLTLNYNSLSDYITLGNDLLITGSGGFLYQAFGSLNLNGKKLTIGNTASVDFAVSATDGSIMGSSTSELIINGTVGYFNGTFDMFMDPSNKSLKTLCLNSSGGQLDISSALDIMDSLSVLDGVLNANGNTTLKSTLSLKGRLGRLGATGSLGGNLTVETFAKGGSTGWAMLGAGGLSGLTFNDWYGQIPMSIEGSTTGVTSAGGYYFESVQGWNENDAYGYDTTETVTSPITVGKGYWVYLGNGFSTTTDMTWSASGTPVTGNVNIPITKTTTNGQNGDNMIANPYASPISWTKLLAGNGNLNNSVYIYNADGGVWSSWVAGASSNGGSDIIPAGQAFWVSAIGATNLTATEACKTANNTSANQLIRPSSSSTQNTNIGQIFRLKLNGTNGDFDETVFRFHPQATTVYDQQWDAYKFFATPGYAGYPGVYSYYTTISSKSSNVDYSINSFPDLTTNSYTIPVLVKVMATGSYTIAPADLQNFTSPNCFVLHDKLLNVNHALANGPYVCNISDTTSAPRFELIVCQQSMPTSVENHNVPVVNPIQISQDMNGAFVKTSFDTPKKATISVYNVIGQQIMKDIQINGTETTTYLPIDLHNQVVMIRVTTDKESVVKKIVLH